MQRLSRPIKRGAEMLECGDRGKRKCVVDDAEQPAGAFAGPRGRPLIAPMQRKRGADAAEEEVENVQPRWLPRQKLETRAAAGGGGGLSNTLHPLRKRRSGDFFEGDGSNGHQAPFPRLQGPGGGGKRARFRPSARELSAMSQPAGDRPGSTEESEEEGEFVDGTKFASQRLFGNALLPEPLPQDVYKNM